MIGARRRGELQESRRVVDRTNWRDPQMNDGHCGQCSSRGSLLRQGERDDRGERHHAHGARVPARRGQRAVLVRRIQAPVHAPGGADDDNREDEHPDASPHGAHSSTSQPCDSRLLKTSPNSTHRSEKTRETATVIRGLSSESRHVEPPRQARYQPGSHPLAVDLVTSFSGVSTPTTSRISCTWSVSISICSRMNASNTRSPVTRGRKSL